METTKRIFNHLMAIVSLLTAFGVFMHDGRVDRAIVARLERPFEGIYSAKTVVNAIKKFIATDAHTHPDHNAARSALMNSFAYQSPAIPPRKEDRHRLQLEDDLGGRHAFDNTNLPIIS